MKNPKIEYPCPWTYTIIGTNEQSLREAVAEVFENKNHSISSSRKSSGGKYISLHLETTVSSEEERNKIFSSLGNYPTVKTVL